MGIRRDWNVEIAMMRRRTASIIVCLLWITVSVHAYSGGAGTAEDPYQIATPEDLIALGNEPNDYDKHFILTADIDLSGYTFTRAVIAPDTDSSQGGFQGVSFSPVSLMPMTVSLVISQSMGKAIWVCSVAWGPRRLCAIWLWRPSQSIAKSPVLAVWRAPTPATSRAVGPVAKSQGSNV